LAAAIVFSMIPGQSVRSFDTFKLRGKADNPDAFYLSATGKMVSYGFIYDPHAADDWMFRTAGGSLGKLSRGQGVLMDDAGGN